MGKKMMTPINKILQLKQQIVLWEYLPGAKQAFRYWRMILQESAREATEANELIMGDPKFLG